MTAVYVFRCPLGHERAVTEDEAQLMTEGASCPSCDRPLVFDRLDLDNGSKVHRASDLVTCEMCKGPIVPHQARMIGICSCPDVHFRHVDGDCRVN